MNSFVLSFSPSFNSKSNQIDPYKTVPSVLFSNIAFEKSLLKFYKLVEDFHLLLIPSSGLT